MTWCVFGEDEPGEGPSGPLSAGFCSHDVDGVTCFDPFLPSMPFVERAGVYSVKRQAGINTILLSVWYRYDPYTELTRKQRPEGVGYKPRDLSGTAGLKELANIIREADEAGLRSVVYLASGEGATPPLNVYNGDLRRICRHMVAEGLNEKIIAALDWETAGGDRSWSVKAQADGLKIIREELGPKATILLHGDQTMRFTPASFLGEGPLSRTPEGGAWLLDESGKLDPATGLPNGFYIEADDPTRGSEMGAWDCYGFKEVDIYGYQTEHGPRGPSFSDGLIGGWLDRLIEGAERFLPDGVVNFHGDLVRTKPLPGADRVAPDWFSGKKRVILWGLETIAFEKAREQVTDARVMRVDELVTKVGVAHGCKPA